MRPRRLRAVRSHLPARRRRARVAMAETLVGRALPEIGVEVLGSLASHRVLSTPQVGAIHAPRASLRWAQRLLVRLHAAELADFIETSHGRRRLWFATERGVRLVREAGTLEADPPPGAEL